MIGLHTWCAFHDSAEDHPKLVTQEMHDAEPALYFFVPLIMGGGAVRVPVCRKHCRELERRYAQADNSDASETVPA